MTDVIMPQMGESIAEGTVTRWMKQVGDRVERDEPLFEISTDKVDAEIPAPAAGVLKEIRVHPGTTVPINTVVGVIGIAGEAVAAAPGPGAPEASADFDHAAKTVIMRAPVFSEPEPPAARVSPPAVAPKPREEMTPEELRRFRSSPLVRRMAAEHGVDLSALVGSGLSGRVTKQDVLHHLDDRRAAATVRMPSAAPLVPSPSTADTVPPPRPSPTLTPPSIGAPGLAALADSDRVQIVPMTAIRKKTAEHMIASKRISAHVSTVWEVDMTRVDQLRRKHQAAYLERHGVKLTYTAFIVKATVDALKAHPILNSSVDGDNVVYKRDVNIGIAVALDWGLIVPVVRNAEAKTLPELARALGDLAERARSKKLKVDEVQGGTFTITNPGVFGGLFGVPIINQPQVGILGVGTIEKRPVIRDDAIAIRTMAYLALTFDHRIVDGADADKFMGFVKRELQEFDEAAL